MEWLKRICSVCVLAAAATLLFAGYASAGNQKWTVNWDSGAVSGTFTVTIPSGNFGSTSNVTLDGACPEIHVGSHGPRSERLKVISSTCQIFKERKAIYHNANVIDFEYSVKPQCPSPHNDTYAFALNVNGAARTIYRWSTWTAVLGVCLDSARLPFHSGSSTVHNIEDQP